jgi:hypothetical protein
MLTIDNCQIMEAIEAEIVNVSANMDKIYHDAAKQQLPSQVKMALDRKRWYHAFESARRKALKESSIPAIFSLAETKMMAAKPQSTRGELSMPRLYKVAKSKVTKLETIPKLARLHYKCSPFYICTLGAEMSNGKYRETNEGSFTGANKPDKAVSLPDKLQKIQVCFRSNETSLHSLTFTGASVVTIEPTSDKDRGRVETLILKPGEELLGCTLHYGDSVTYGISWITWKRPVRQ